MLAASAVIRITLAPCVLMLVNLIGLPLSVITSYLVSLGEKPFRAQQIWHWIYNKRVINFSAMTDLSPALRAKLAEQFVIRQPEVKGELVSQYDSTRKWVLRLADGQVVETVYIPQGKRGTVCLSSQVGCTLSCRFCCSGTQKLVRHLTAHEIIGQFLVVRDSICAQFPITQTDCSLPSNVVVMGMGEPLLNYDNILTTLRILTDPHGIALPGRRLTISTAGIAPMIRQLGKDINCNLAVSLHAATDDLRSKLMPINRKYPLSVLIAACCDYLLFNRARYVTFEYILLGKINDSEGQADTLVKLVKGLPCKFNLIPFNPWLGAPISYRRSEDKDIHRFITILREAGHQISIRSTRGHDISAACGQLRLLNKFSRETQVE